MDIWYYGYTANDIYEIMVNMIIQRDIIHKIKPFLERRECLALIGPRQTGKTTLLQLITDYLYKEKNVDKELVKRISFEDRKLLFQFEKDPCEFVRSYWPGAAKQTFYFMIDEFQYASEGGQKLKLIYDTFTNLKLLITGSSSLDLRAQVGKYMVGRILSFYIYPFNFHEILKTRSSRLERAYARQNKQIKNWLFENQPLDLKKGDDLLHEEMTKAFEDYCVWGGYPQIVLTEDIEQRKKVLNDLYNNYLLKDIKTSLELATEKELYKLSQYIATQVGQITVYQNLSQASGLEYRTLKKHLSILEETFIIKSVTPFFRNKQKELSRNPKIFFLDMGFRNALIDDINDLEKRPDAGNMVENTVYVQLLKNFIQADKLNFYRTKMGSEIDFITWNNHAIIPMEVKYKVFKQEQISKGFRSFIEQFKPEKAIVWTKNFWGMLEENGTQILFAPGYYC